jgi:hypothetical protein
MLLFIILQPSVFAQDIINGVSYEDLDGDGTKDKITLNIIYNDEDYNSFLLIINNAEILDRHHYNTDGYTIVDIDKSDDRKEIAVHTPNANGPDEYIIYSYDGENIKRIGSTQSFTKFNGDGTLDVETYMSFWVKHDKYIYNKETDALDWVRKTEYDINEEYTVTEDFAVFPAIGSANTLGFVSKGEKIKITQVVLKDDCRESGAYSEELCDVFFYTTADGRQGSATLKDLIGKVDLPLQP